MTMTINTNRLTFMVVFVIGLLFSYLAFHITMSLQDRNALAAQKRLQEQVKESLTKTLEIHKENLAGIERFFLASSFVNRHEFRLYVTAYLKKHPSIQALEWIPVVFHNEKEVYERNAKSDGHEGFSIRELDVRGNLVPVSSRPKYYPVYYLEPLTGNESALGFDLGSDAARRKTLIKARETRTMQATASITLVQDKNKQKGFLIFTPVFKPSDPNSKETGERLLGFALGVFRINGLVESVIMHSEGDINLLAIRLDDTTDPGNPTQLYGSNPVAAKSSKPGSPWQLSSDIKFAGRKWTLTSTATPAFIAQKHDWTPWFVMITGVVLTLLLAAYLHVITNRGRLVNELVRSRTIQLQASRSRIKAILLNAVNAIITIDSGGNVTLFNPAAERMFGYPREEVLGQNVKMLMPEPYHSEHDGYLEHHLGTGEKKIIGIGREVVGRRKDGSEFQMHLAVGEAHTDDTKSFVGIITDISQLKQIESDLIEAKELAEQANKHKSSFLNIMSHELRTPLTVILGYLPMLKDRNKMPSPENIEQIAQDMDISGQHLLELINDILDISKIEAGEMNLHIEQIDVQQLMEDMKQRFSHKAQINGLELQTETDGFLFRADLRRIRQILINLVGNAIKFTQEGKIIITAKRDTDVVSFSVTDSGIGIPKSDLPYIFDPFRQVDDSSTRKIGGSGLGLAITKKLVELHGGQVMVESNYGSGSTFTFTIKQQEYENGKNSIG